MTHTEPSLDPALFECPAGPVNMVLAQLEGLVKSMTDQQYTQCSVGYVESCIGSHLRHCLDHVEALVQGMITGTVDYDHRDRGTPVEKDRQVGLDKLHGLMKALAAIKTEHFDQKVEVSVFLFGDEQSEVTTSSSVGRELGFLINHTVHHNAIIAVIAGHLGIDLPEDFGLAPSTIVYNKSQCAQ